MTNMLIAIASHWAGSAVPCRFKAFADNVPLATPDDTQPLYDIPAGTSEVKLVTIPLSPVYWETEVLLSVSSTGVMTVKANSSPFARLRSVSTATSRGTVVLVKVSRCKDVTTAVYDELTKPPATRRMKINDEWVTRAVDEVAAHKNLYGTWPPPDWGLQPLPNAHYIDGQAPVSAAGNLSFAKTRVPPIDVENVVLQIAGKKQVPALFGVTWPKALVRSAGAAPTRFLVYFRQTNKGNRYDEIGLFVGGEVGKKPYPFNFDYSDTGLFESLHYGTRRPPQPASADPSAGPFFWVGSKGVPYQVAESGAQIVTVTPCGEFGPEYGVLKDTEQLARILEEIQAFMFWRAGIEDPPTGLGASALAAFSSANYGLTSWLKDDNNLKGNFLKQTLKAVYFLDPPKSDDCIAAALKWAKKATDPRIRLYSQQSRDSHKQLLGLTASQKLPAAPYVENGLGNTRTAAALPVRTWVKTFTALFGARKPPYQWADIHHIIPGTMLTHALSQGDF